MVAGLLPRDGIGMPTGGGIGVWADLCPTVLGKRCGGSGELFMIEDPNRGGDDGLSCSGAAFAGVLTMAVLLEDNVAVALIEDVVGAGEYMMFWAGGDEDRLVPLSP